MDTIDEFPDTDGYHALQGISTYISRLERYPLEMRNDQYYSWVSLSESNLERVRDQLSHEHFHVVKDRIDQLLLLKRDNHSNIQDNVVTLGKVESNGRGNKQYDINKDHLEHLLTMGCQITTIAKDGLLGKKLHPNTIHKFISRNGMKSVKARYSDIPDEDLKVHIKDLNKKFPRSGICQIWSMLKTLSPPIRVQRDKVAKFLSEIDPAGATMRWAQVIPRRIYSVKSPNSLWHIDTHHKLIRYTFLS